ncbi:MAG: hypothetical protein H6825_16490, partial [Planctomycetes bacterium]|nr:hypothetical protein [Planctomycetota bacterium]
GGGADCDLFNCGSGGSGGDCLELHDPGSSAIARDVVYEPGAGGGDGDGGGSGASGLPQRVLGGTTFDFTASYRDLDASSPVREGQLLTLDFAGEPGDALLLFAGIFGGHVNMIGHQGVFLIAPPLVLPGVFVGVLPAGGLVAAPLVVPEMGPGIEGLDLHLQAVFDDGTTALLGPARVVTLLDAAF